MIAIVLFGVVIFAMCEYRKAQTATALTSPMTPFMASPMIPPRYAVLQTVAGPAQPVWSVPAVFAGSPQGSTALPQTVLPPNSGRIATGWNSLGIMQICPLQIPGNKATQYSWVPAQYQPPVGAMTNQNGGVCPTVIQ